MKKLAFKGGDELKQADYSETKRRTKIAGWLKRFNNVSVEGVDERGTVTFSATKFAAEGIARESGFDVYSLGGNRYSLDTRQSRVGKRIVDRNEGLDPTTKAVMEMRKLAGMDGLYG
jgi:hypothetical protein